jgi:hypothetical protein
MQLTPVTCNHCGAALDVPPDARFVTCRYCSSRLEIKRTPSTITTEVLERIGQNTASMAEDLSAIRRETEIERLDREWSQRQAELVTHDSDGNVSKPSAVGGLLGAVIMGGVGIVWTIGAFGITSAGKSAGLGAPNASLGFFESVFPCFGLVAVAIAVGMGIKSVTDADKYSQEYERYQQRRAELLRQTPSDPTRPQPHESAAP